MPELIDFSCEGSSKASLAKLLRSMGDELGYPLTITVSDGEGGTISNVPNAGVTIVVNVPHGANRNGIPPGYIIRGPFVHKEAVFDNTVDPPVLVTPAITSPNWHIDVRLSGPAADRDRDNDGVNEITRSTLKAWIERTGATLQRAGLNPDHTGNITYYEKTLSGGDWVRLYVNLVRPKHEFFGGRRI